ncbi:MAG: hypothetical protein R3F43_10070 [bacterium]
MSRLAGVRACLFDMDGTLYVGPRAMEGPSSCWPPSGPTRTWC